MILYMLLPYVFWEQIAGGIKKKTKSLHSQCEDYVKPIEFI